MILLYQPFQNRTIPLLCTITLASLVKGRWIDGKAQTVSLLRLFAIYPPFLFTKLFCRQDGGIAFLPHPFRFSDSSVDNPSIVGSASHCNRSSPLHKGAKGDSALPTFSKPHYSLLRTITLASLVKGEVLSPEIIRATTGGIAFLPHPFRFSDTSVNNPSVTVTENTILCQRIFNFYKKLY